MAITFLSWKVFISGSCHANEHAYLNMDHVCLIDNWLCILISDKW